MSAKARKRVNAVMAAGRLLTNPRAPFRKTVRALARAERLGVRVVAVRPPPPTIDLLAGIAASLRGETVVRVPRRA